MSHCETPESQDRLPRALECVLRAVLLREGTAIPVTPREVALYQAQVNPACQELVRPSQTPSFLYSWERSAPRSALAEVVAFESQSIVDGLAYAARAEAPVSEETRAKLSRMVVQMHRGKTQRHA